MYLIKYYGMNEDNFKTNFRFVLQNSRFRKIYQTFLDFFKTSIQSLDKPGA